MDIIVENITKTYEKGKVKALDTVGFGVEKGELFGLIGPDGAGKTSLFRILTTLLLADSGRAEVAGYEVVKDYRAIRQIVGYMPGRFALYQDLTVEENLNFFATVFHTSVKENYDLIKDIYAQIEPFKTRRAGKLSGGMKQKLALCCALIHRPRVLFLDEPTTGVDPVSRKEFWEMLKRLKGQDLSILVSTPYMDEAALCDRIALIHKSKILEINTPQGIIDKFGKNLWAVQSSNMYQLLQDLRAFSETQSCFSFGESHHLVLKNEKTPIEKVRVFLNEKGHQAIDIQLISPSVEDCFMALSDAS
ncbi:MAG: ABC transporter ATP-binding protein [Microscillaceae bacterium]|jgi:ABC-type multidrug transport system ATPase subunit|nr:ABC transporter ATP-binding protein [Microscillaceae bacterium]